MARGASRFRQSDVTRALRAVAAAGMHVARVELGPDGRMVITMGGGERIDPANALDKWMADHASETQRDQ